MSCGLPFGQLLLLLHRYYIVSVVVAPRIGVHYQTRPQDRGEMVLDRYRYKYLHVAYDPRIGVCAAARLHMHMAGTGDKDSNNFRGSVLSCVYIYEIRRAVNILPLYDLPY